MGDSTESFYSGGVSSLDSDYGIKSGGPYMGYRLSAGRIGFPGSSQTANQLTEAINAIKQGTKTFEVTMVSPETADQIPKQHFEEMRALMKLTGVSPSVHAPIIDPSGFGEQGFNKDSLKDTERRFFSTIEKAHMLDPTGNVPVVFHASNAAGSTYIPGENTKPGEEDRFHARQIAIVDPETGEVKAVKENERYTIGSSQEQLRKGRMQTVDAALKMQNATKWDNEITQFAMAQKAALEQTDRFKEQLASNPVQAAIYAGTEIPEGVSSEQVAQEKMQNFSQQDRLKVFSSNLGLNLNSMFEQAYKHLENSEQKESMEKLSEQYGKEMYNLRKEAANKKMPFEDPVKEMEIQTRYFDMLRNVTGEESPQFYVEAETFARKKAAETFSNVAFKSYQKFGDSAPIMAIENMMQGMAQSKSSDMKQLIEDTRDNFVKKAVKEGISEGDARAQAKKLIGVTWDVGHLNIMKKQGFTDEDVISETSKIKNYVKHIHLTDNFGYGDSHLAPGMGNVPFKAILQELEKTGRLDEMKKIVEAPGFVQHFKKSPHSTTLAAFGSPIYSMQKGPYWNQASMMAQGGGGYFGSPLAYLPEKHFSTYGSGFSSLPAELGGQIPGTQSRFSGTPNA